MNQQTLEKLHQLRLFGMAELHQQHLQNNQYQQLSPDEYLALLTEHEWEERQARRVKGLFKLARFRQKASIAEVDFTSSRNLDKNMFTRLSSLDFMKRSENIIITGASGTGKSYLAQALGHQACLLQKKVQYHITAHLLDHLQLTKLDGTYRKTLAKINHQALLILDDFGLQSFNKSGRESLMDIIEGRHTSCSTIIASQLPVSTWHELIGEHTIADAILDRIVNSSHRIDLKGESLRKGMIQPTTT